MKKRDDEKIFDYKYRDKVYWYMIPDLSIETKDGVHYTFHIIVNNREDNDSFAVNFRLLYDDIDCCQSCIENQIRKHVDEEKIR